ncbi:hypothetical protein DICVIV_03134 [Dictyocaulus viviparus]|uniref:Uncharacterized protein n=1 Tax=Dictyocaulus viviparus TaxID=29172 RepID=A0A0D8Y3Y0_DICVI|nr:hypothetical protein DICVIV_03134 [Dictyocaulus viviparus]
MQPQAVFQGVLLFYLLYDKVMDSVVEVVQAYRHELEETMQSLRQRGEALGQSAPKLIEDTKSQIEPKTQQLFAAVQDTSAVSPAPKPVVEIFAWATVMILFANIGILIGSYILGPILSAILGKTGAAILAFIVVPSYAHISITEVCYIHVLIDIIMNSPFVMTLSITIDHDIIMMRVRLLIWSYMVKCYCAVRATPDGYTSICQCVVNRRHGLTTHFKKSGGDDAAVRFEVLSLAIAQGILMGFVIDSLYLSAIPFAILTPAIITASFPVVTQAAGGNRVTILAGTIGASVIINLAIGLIIGSLSFTYFLLTLTYGSIAAVIMQLIFRNLQEGAKGHVYQNALSCGFVIAKGMFFLLFGSSEPETY